MFFNSFGQMQSCDNAHYQCTNSSGDTIANSDVGPFDMWWTSPYCWPDPKGGAAGCAVVVAACTAKYTTQCNGNCQGGIAKYAFGGNCPYNSEKPAKR